MSQPTREELVLYARQAARTAGIDENIFVRQIDVESGFQNLPANAAGAVGVAQIIPRWHPAVDPTDAYASLRYAASLMRSYLDDYDGDWTAATIRYNGGGAAIEAWQNGEPYDESRRYVRAILGKEL